MTELRELLSLLSQFADKPVFVAVIVLFGFRRIILQLFETQLSEWHRSEHDTLCGLPCKPSSLKENAAVASSER